MHEHDMTPFTDEAFPGHQNFNNQIAKFIAEALELAPGITPGTYELCGPKVQGNPEGFSEHRLIRHGHEVIRDLDDASCDFDSLRAWLQAHEWEGIVWHHPDGRMAKLKRRDFPRDPA